MSPTDLLDRPIAFHRIFVTITGSVSAALMLSQGLYWSKRTTLPDGWFYKTQKEWEDETGLTRSQQETARRDLIEKGFWKEELRGMPGKLHFRLDKFALDKILLSLYAENLQTEMQDLSKQECGNPANKNAEIPQTFMTENTPKTTSKKKTAAPSEAQHPAIQLFRSLTSRYPDKSLYQKVIAVLGDTPNADLLTRCYSEWVSRGWNKMNLAWLFDWYPKGEPQQKGNPSYAKTGNGTTANQPAPASRIQSRRLGE